MSSRAGIFFARPGTEPPISGAEETVLRREAPRRPVAALLVGNEHYYTRLFDIVKPIGRFSFVFSAESAVASRMRSIGPIKRSVQMSSTRGRHFAPWPIIKH